MPEEALSRSLDLSACAREPIHIPGSIQPHGMLFVLEGERFSILQVSENVAEFCHVPASSAIGRNIAQIVPDSEALILEAMRTTAFTEAPTYLGTLELAGRSFRAVAHRSKGAILLELELSEFNENLTFRELDPVIRRFISELATVTSLEEMSNLAAREIRSLSGLDRVLIYKFDKDWNGTVIAEDRNDRLPSYLDLRFPASDIPAQARELYRLNRLRLIANVDYEPVKIVPVHQPGSDAPLDLSFSVLRSVSPVHLEYMRNMGTASSMSISILNQGKLWGLISCHGAEPHTVQFEVRNGCDVIAQVLALQIAAFERQQRYEHRVRTKVIEARLLTSMTSDEEFTKGLLSQRTDLLALVGAEGAAVLNAGECTRVGQTPDEEFIRDLAAWIAEHGSSEGDSDGVSDLFHTDSLAELWPEARQHVGRSSGVLAISISKIRPSYVIWFRPEVVQTVRWGGDPRKPVESANGSERISPRKSFEQWKETVRHRALPWQSHELEAALDLRNAIIGIVLRTAEELAEISGELERSNKELEAFSYSVSHDLRAPFRHIVGYAELLREASTGADDPTTQRYIATIIESAQYAGKLVDNLLNFSQIGRIALQHTRLNMTDLVAAVVRDMKRDLDGRAIEWKIGDLPAVEGDAVLLRLAWQNLLENAVKYTRGREPAIIEVSCAESEWDYVFSVVDNGVGFEMQYVDKLFGVFQRLHRMEDFEGTGIGLANVRRIITRHGGKTWAEGAVGKGAKFYFTLPREAGKGSL